jgi:hypothetical protein
VPQNLTAVNHAVQPDPHSLLWPRSMAVEIAARYISATPWSVEEMCRCGEIVAYKQGKRWTVDRLELDRYVARRHAEAASRSIGDVNGCIGRDLLREPAVETAVRFQDNPVRESAYASAVQADVKGGV